MSALKATVVDGHLVLSTPTDLPDGTVVPLEPASDWDDLDDKERRALHQAIEQGERELDAGKGVTTDELWARLKAIA